MGNSTATWCGAVVVLEDGAIYSHKTNRGEEPAPQFLSGGYFLRGVAGPNTRVETARFDGDDCFERAEEWRRQWPVHPEAKGFPPYEAAGPPVDTGTLWRAPLEAEVARLRAALAAANASVVRIWEALRADVECLVQERDEARKEADRG